MKILAIETSCDETAISIIDARKEKTGFLFQVLGNALLSQTKIHAHYGGVFPMVAKREHGRALVPLLKSVLAKSGFLKKIPRKKHSNILENIRMFMEREPELAAQFAEFVPTIKTPPIDRIAVTSGPGLEPALWVGINFARALSEIWNIPVVPVNHMEGHIFSAMLKKYDLPTTNYKLKTRNFPMLALLVSGGHTELVLSKKRHQYKVIGKTRDDAAGEAFDKVARMLSLPYPGGPEISRLAKKGKENPYIKLPRPMVNSKDFDFSFSGLKTAVLYLIKKTGKLSAQKKADIAKEFENSAIEVLVSKTIGAAKIHKAKTVIIGGGVSANEKLRREIAAAAEKNLPGTKLLLPEKSLTTDNAIMIAAAAYFKKTIPKASLAKMRAEGNLSL